MEYLASKTVLTYLTILLTSLAQQSTNFQGLKKAHTVIDLGHNEVLHLESLHFVGTDDVTTILGAFIFHL